MLYQFLHLLTGFNIVAKGNQSFKKLLDQGISEHIHEIEVINDTATHELEIERSLDRMSREINSYKLTVSKDEDSGGHLLQTMTIEIKHKFYK